MSLFLLTNDFERAKVVENEFSSLFNKKAETVCLDSKIYLTMSAAFKSKIICKKAKHSNIFVFGTIFNGEGFHENALSSIEDAQSFFLNEKEGLYGHYIIIIKESDRLYVITDKLGMLNVYYAKGQKHYYVSNDLVAICIASKNSKLSECGSKQFILREATIGRYSVIENIKRLSFGHLLELDNNSSLLEKKNYSYQLPKLTFNEYLDRIKKYFTCLNNYQGKISVDLSGGYDTRMIAAISHQLVNGIEANTNPNLFDGGIDMALAPIVADKIGLPLTIIDNQNNIEIEKSLMLHATSVGRDIIRSKQWPYRLKKKYEKFGLILGGYGGETMRAAKHDKTNDVCHIAEGYYRGSEAEYLYGFKGFVDAACKGLQDLLFDEVVLDKQKSNWLYTVDRMRNWGGAQVLMLSLYGDILHPFMDWYLIAPVFSLTIPELKNGKFQDKIISTFAPQLENIPINSLSNKDSLLRDVKNTLKESFKYDRRVKMLMLYAKRVWSAQNDKKRLGKLYEILAKSNIDIEDVKNLGIDLTKMERFGDVDSISRIATLVELTKYIEANC